MRHRGSSSQQSSKQQQTLPPFQPLPKPLHPLAPHLSRDKIYLLHLDRTPWEAKLYSFIIPFLGYTIIALGLLYRFLSVATTYPAFLLAFFDPPTTTINANTPTEAAAGQPNRRIIADFAWVALGMGFDYVLANTAWPIVARFFFGGAIGYRRAVGFSTTEIIVRESGGNWGQNVAAAIGGAVSKGGDGGNDATDTAVMESALQDIIIPACDARLLAEKPGPMLTNAHWMMNARLSGEAYAMLMRREATYADFSTAVLVNSHATTTGAGASETQQQQQDQNQVGLPSQWFIWYTNAPPSASPESSAASDVSTNERAKILQFQRKLSELGHEDLFYRWVEVVQYESSHPDGFTAERQEKAWDETKRLFQGAGLEFDEFFDSVGGMKGVVDENEE